MKKIRVIRIRRGAAAGLAALLIAALSLAAAAARAAVRPVSANAGVAVPVLMYHSVLKDPARAGKYVVSPAQLAQDLDYLTAHGYTSVTMTEVIASVSGGAPLPEKPVVITFDDGYYNNYLYAYPLLRERGMKAVISIIGRYTDLFSERDENNAYYSHCTWDQLREMQQSGLIEIQNHTYNLHTYDRSRHGCASLKWETMDDYRRTVGADIQKLQQRIRDELGSTPNTMVYPFGSFTERSEQLVRELGFSASLSCESGVTHVTGPESLFGMKRFLRPAGTDSASFFASIGLNR